jgi:VCBS repeat-containing protein
VTATSGLPYAGTGSFSGRVEAPFDDVEGYVLAPAALLSEGIDSLSTGSSSTNLTAYGSVTIDDDGSFTYTRDPGWAVVPVGEIDDSFAIIAYTAGNQWAVALVPVGGATVPNPSISGILDSAPDSLQDA